MYIFRYEEKIPVLSGDYLERQNYSSIYYVSIKLSTRLEIWGASDNRTHKIL